jgi:hypothetical protein
MPLEYAPIINVETTPEVGDLTSLDGLFERQQRNRLPPLPARDHA